MVLQTTALRTQTQNLTEFMASSRARYFEQITATANALRNHSADTPIILLAGPSGSGKTTSALLLARQLSEWGFKTHTLSMDNYFMPLTEEQIELMHQHKLDLESPTRVDDQLLNEQLHDLMEGKEIPLPRYDFPSSSRVYDGNTLKRNSGELVIMEGIHALNPAVTGQSSNFSAKIYVSVRTRVQAEDGTVLHPSHIRLMRRMLRDNIFRQRAMEDTIKMLQSVDAGEDKYIMPFKNQAQYQIDTFIPFELGVYKSELDEIVRKLTPDFPELTDMAKILSEIDAIDTAHVPEDSLIREFIGGSIWDY